MTIEQWLDNDQLGIDIWNNKYRVNNESLDEWFDRVSGGDEELKQLIIQKKFLFGGRILAGRGINEGKRTLSNCYVTSVDDSIESIFDCGYKIARTMSVGGGVGVDISKLRPNGAKVNNAAKSTSGAVSFMDFFSHITGLIAQNGRRGALMLSISCEHPDIEEFINIKKDLDKVTKANISIRMTDLFMKAARDNKDVELEFQAETGELITKTINARDILMKVAKSNWEMGEPGMLFWDRISNWNLLSNNPEFEYAGVNPCAEEPLPSGGSCLLGSLNLSEFIINREFDYDGFAKAVSIAVRGLNKVLDEGLPKHPLQEQRDSVRDWRQIGLGIFGLADALIKMGVKYGDDSIEFINTMGEHLINSALLESANLAKEFGAYPKYNNLVLESDFFKYVTKNHPEVVEVVRKHGLRNSQLLTCAPTGSLASLLNTSGSAEAIFATSYNRRTLSLKDKETIYKVYPKIIKEFIDKGYSEDNLPDYIVTAHKIPYRERLNVQATLNTWIDASISSTCNVPESITIKEVADLYLYAWEVGCKGVTIWRDNCKRAAILTTSSTPTTSTPEVKFNSILPISRKKIGTTVGATHCRKCACGTLYITTNLDKDGNLVELFTHTSKGGICQANLSAVTRMVSLNLRSGVAIDEIVDQLKGIHCPACQMVKAKGGTVDGLSCPDIISRTIKEFIDKGWSLCQNYDEEEKPVIVNSSDKCPECGEPMTRSGGCVNCLNCGYSHCG